MLDYREMTLEDRKACALLAAEAFYDYEYSPSRALWCACFLKYILTELDLLRQRHQFYAFLCLPRSGKEWS